ncbi:unnamed protein product [Brassica oleracea]
MGGLHCDLLFHTVSGEVPEEPVVSTKSGLWEVSCYWRTSFTIDDIVPIKTGKLASLDCLERSRILYQTACVKAEWNLIKTLPDLSGPGKATCVKFGSGARYIAVGSMDSNLRIFGIPSDERANNE